MKKLKIFEKLTSSKINSITQNIDDFDASRTALLNSQNMPELRMRDHTKTLHKCAKYLRKQVELESIEEIKSKLPSQYHESLDKILDSTYGY